MLDGLHPSLVRDKPPQVRYVGPPGSKQRFADFDVPGDLAALGSSREHTPDWPEQYPDYLGCCWSIDRNLGRLRDSLKRLGLEENTLIIYTSDHGCHFRTRNSEYKRSCHDASIRIPLIVRGPGFEGGRVIDNPVSLIDLPATVLHAAEAERLPVMDGRPLHDLVGDGAADWPQEVFVQISETQNGRAIRTRRWKYAVIDPNDLGKPEYRDRRYTSECYVEDCLYDLAADPHELNNLVRDADHAPVRRDLAKRLARRMVRAGEPEPAIRPAGA